MKKILTFFLLCIAVCAQAQTARPKLVVGLVVDQMRWDYLYYYYNEYGEGGLKRLLSEGYSCGNCQINYAPTVTAVGHTSIFTGSVPSIHGIAGNSFYLDGGSKETENCYDGSVKGVGSNGKAGQRSPHLMRTSTIGDELRLSNDYQSKVVGVALKDRAAILPAGHTANAAYWWDTEAGHFITSTYYMNALPQWVVDFNKQNHTAPGYDIKASNEGVTMTFRMAEAAIKGEQLGQDDATDLLTVSVSSTDLIGHIYSTRGKENHDVYMQLDKDLASFLQMLDATVGKGNYLLFLTADHGAAHNYNMLRSHKYPAGAWDYSATTKGLNEYLKGKFKLTEDPVLPEDNYQFTFNEAVLAKADVDLDDAVEEAVKWLRTQKDFIYVVDNEHLSEATLPAPIKERLINGYCHGRSGQITVVTRPQYFGGKDNPNYKGTQHGQPFPYDTHIPCIYYGWNVPHGETTQETHVTDIVATVCAMLHIQMPNGCIGEPTQLK